MRSLLSPAHSRLRRVVAAAAATGVVLLGSSGVAQAATGPTFTVNANPANNQFGSMVPEVLSASGLPADASGTVSFTDLYANPLCSSPVIGGTTSGCDYFLGYQAGGTFTITATYSGDGTYAASVATTTYTVTPAPSAFTVSASPASQVYGDPVTLSESGFPDYASGSITFRDDATGADLCTIADIQATQSCQTDGTQSAGPEDVTASYSGDNDFQPSTAPTSYLITKATIVPSVTVNPDPSTYGQTLTFTESGFPAAATGTITYTGGHTGGHTGQVLCTETLPATSCLTDVTQPPGAYTVVATYNGDANYTASTSADTGYTVTRAPAPFTAAADPNPADHATRVSLTDSGLPDGSGPGPAATGTITYTDATTGHVLCTTTLPDTTCLSDGTQPSGRQDVTAAYTGDTFYAPSTAAFSYMVKVATTMGVTVTPATVAPKHTIVLQAVGLPAGATGTIDFGYSLVGGQSGNGLCTATLPTTRCTVAAPTQFGTYRITGNYSGDASYSSVSSTATLTVASPVGVRVTGTGPGNGTMPAASPTDENLAFTGADLTPGIAGLILLTIGAALIWAARRRHTRPTA